MEKFNNGDLVQRVEPDKVMIVIVTWANGDHFNTFKGTVLSSDFDFYKVGEHSGTWHEGKFELCEQGTSVTITN